jgi:hypothetical protein
MYIVGSKLNQQLLYKSGVYLNNEPSDEIILQNVVNLHGGIISDYSVFRIDDQSIYAKRMLNNDEFNLVWSSSSPNGTISAIDFFPEDSKLWIKFYSITGKTEIFANQTDYVDIMIEVWKADKSGLATQIDGTENVPVLTPHGPAEMRCQFQNGKCIKRIATTLFGNWMMPTNINRIGQYRIYNAITIKALVPFV